MFSKVAPEKLGYPLIQMISGLMSSPFFFKGRVWTQIDFLLVKKGRFFIDHQKIYFGDDGMCLLNAMCHGAVAKRRIKFD